MYTHTLLHTISSIPSLESERERERDTRNVTNGESILSQFDVVVVLQGSMAMATSYDSLAASNNLSTWSFRFDVPFHFALGFSMP